MPRNSAHRALLATQRSNRRGGEESRGKQIMIVLDKNITPPLKKNSNL